MSIGKVAKLTGVSVRTLHYYDEIGLLIPSEISDAGYRYYDETELEILQQIMFYRELDFSLDDIQQIMKSDGYDKLHALKRQKELLMLKQERLTKLISLIDNTIKGEKSMSFNEFDMSEIEKAKNEYSAEVKERWGNTDAYAQSNEKTKNYSKEKWQEITEDGDRIFEWFAKNMDKSMNDQEVLDMVKEWQDLITSNFYTCTPEILSGLAEMYICDERFKKNIDKYAEGTAQFLHDAIKEYCKG